MNPRNKWVEINPIFCSAQGLGFESFSDRSKLNSKGLIFFLNGFGFKFLNH